MKIMLLKSFLLVGAIMCFGLAKAQTVSGNVSDDNGPLLGASVVVKGTANGTTADFDGNFTIQAGSGDTLVFSYVGYTAQEVAVGNQTTINVVLVANNELDEVIVTGYGGQKEKEITSAVVSVGEEEFNKGNVNDPTQLLQGKVAGLQIYNKGGNPNAGAQIRLRGISTTGANQSPLVVIDGVIGASLANVDPSDIASINVLKDASAAAIYGSRGSSGVILVTTKKGVAGDVKISYNTQYSSASVLNQIDLMTPEEFVAAGGRDLGSKTDWIDAVTRTAASKVHNVSLSGGAGSTSYRVSANYRDVEGILQNSGFKQMNTRLNFSTRALNDKLKIEFSSSFTDRDQKNGFNESLRYATLYNPTAPIYAVDAPYAFNGDQFGGYFETLGLFDSYNPVSIIQQNKNEGNKVEFNYSANFTYSLTDNLAVYFNAANQVSKSGNKTYFKGTDLWGGSADSPSRKGSATFYDDEYSFRLYESYLTWNKSFGENSNLVLTGGYSYQKQNFNSHSVTVGDFPDTNFDWSNAIQYGQDLLNQGLVGANSVMAPDSEIEAYFGRANITFNDKFFLNASLRREGSSKLGEGNKYGTFPAIGIGTDLNNFFNFENVNQLKARLSYGVTGNLPSGNGLSQEVRGFGWAGSGTSGGSTFLTRAANPDLKWEQKSETNFGIDFNMDRLTASFDIYKQETKDLLSLNEVDATIYGFSTRWENSGDLTSQGVELAINYDLIKGDGLSYNTGIVLSKNKTTLGEYSGRQQLGDLGAPGQNGSYAIVVRTDREIGEMWVPLWDGTVTDGAPNFVDINGDGVLKTNFGDQLSEDGDFALVGKGTPDLELGWTNQLTFGDWSVNAFFRGAFGHSLVNTFRAFYEPRVGSQKSYNYVNTELADNQITKATLNSLYIEKADFFKLDNLTVARNLNLKGNVFDSATLSLNVQNAFVLTKYTGSDPEPALADMMDNNNVLAPGMDRRNSYYSARTFTVGLNINF